MSPFFFVLLYTLYVLKPTASTGNEFCGSRYRLDNESVTIYGRADNKVQVALAERWMGQKRKQEWRIAPKRPYAAQIKTKIKSYIRATNQYINITMNNVTNGSTVWYKNDIDTSVSTSGKAKLVIGEPPSIVTFNNGTGNGYRAMPCGENSVTTPNRFVCFKLFGVPFPTLSLYCNSTQVQERDIQKEQNDAYCLNVTCEGNLMLVAVNCFGNETKTVLGGCPRPRTSSTSGRPDVFNVNNLPNGTVHETTPSVPGKTTLINATSSPSQFPTMTLATSRSSTPTRSQPSQSSPMAASNSSNITMTPSASNNTVIPSSSSESPEEFYMQWQFILMLMIAGAVLIMVVILLIFCTQRKQKAQGLYTVNPTLPTQQRSKSDESPYSNCESGLYENGHVIDYKSNDSAPYEDVFPYMVTPGNTIRGNAIDPYNTAIAESQDGYLEPLTLTGIGSRTKGCESSTSALSNGTKPPSEILV